MDGLGDGMRRGDKHRPRAEPYDEAVPVAADDKEVWDGDAVPL